jgi:hypothetical protein
MNESSISEVRPFSNELDFDSNLILGLIGGSLAMLICAAIWGVITYFLEYQISWMAIGVGFLVGVAVRRFGKGKTLIFGLSSAVLSLLGCVLGNYLFYIGILSREWGVPFIRVLFGVTLDPAAIIEIFTVGFDFRDLLFYAIAAYVGYQTTLAKSK